MPPRAISTAWAWRSLVRREAPADTGAARQAPELSPRRGSRPWPSSRGPVDHAEERTNRQLHPELQLEIKLPPSPIVHANLAALATLAMPDEHRSAPGLEVSLGECQGLADPKTGSPEDDRQPSKAQSRRPLPGLAHQGDDLLHPRWIGGVAAALVLRDATCVVTRERGWRASAACGVELSNGTMVSSSIGLSGSEGRRITA
jgi:hypothetical protein